MDITDVKIFPVNEDKLKAFVSIIIDNCFVISDIKVILGNNGLFVSMPSKKRKNGTFRDIAHPLNNETRKRMEERIFEEYFKVANEDVKSHQPRTLSEQGDAAGPADETDEGFGTAPERITGPPTGGHDADSAIPYGRDPGLSSEEAPQVRPDSSLEDGETKPGGDYPTEG